MQSRKVKQAAGWRVDWRQGEPRKGDREWGCERMRGWHSLSCTDRL